ncbi:MAG: HNH/ENDO VII family nuclease, partial [Bacteroidales bacterium]|nr:HNH/ENDO VII family nuclease [Bacteroidales bacterium]
CATTEPTAAASTEKAVITTVDDTEQVVPTQAPLILNWNQEVQFTGMSDASLPRYLEDTVYTSLVSGLDSDKYFVESVQAVYVSQEYLQELAYNSMENVFFGYSLSDLDQFFEGTRYVFTLGEDGNTTVEPLQVIEDTTYERILTNVAIGTGVILVCVVISVATAGAGATAVSAVFAVAAKSGAVCAISGTAIGGFGSAMVKYLETGDMDESLKAGAIGASEGYKWGAITGTLKGATKEAWGLYSASHASAASSTTGEYLTMNQVAQIQQESGYPLDIIRQFHRVEEYEAFRAAGLQTHMIDGQLALVRTDIDLSIVDDAGRTNLERMKAGLAALDSTGNPFELHHIGQRENGTLAILTRAEHDNPTIHNFLDRSEINRTDFNKIRQEFWKKMANVFSGT